MKPLAEIEDVRNRGIVGAGGGGFPTFRKLANPSRIIVVNGAECEPLLLKDKYLLEHRLEVLSAGLEMARSLTRADKVVVATKDPVKLNGAENYLLPDVYPAGDEHVLVQEVTGKKVPENGYPLDIGVCVLNVETLVNLAQPQPVIHKLLTVAGEVTRPGVYDVPIGMMLSELAKKAGGPSTGVAYICGGPMMGDIVDPTITSVSKITSALLVLPLDHPVVKKKSELLDLVARRARSNCIQCQFCTDLCPRALLGHGIKPHLAMRAFGYQLENGYNPRIGLASCSSCGVCEMYACPLDLSPRRVILHLQKRDGESEHGNAQRHPLATERQVPWARLLIKLGLRKYLTSIPTQLIQLPANEVMISLISHGGEVARPCVEVGDVVSVGAVVAKPQGELGVPAHSSIAGTVKQASLSAIVIGA